MRILIWIWIVLFIIKGFINLIVSFTEEEIADRIIRFIQTAFDIVTIYLLYTALIK